MNADIETAKVLVMKARSDIEMAELAISKDHLHDKVGANLHSAVEKLIKSYLHHEGVLGIPTSGKDGHDLLLLFRMARQTNFPIEDYQHLLKLQPYDSRSEYEFVADRSRTDLSSVLRTVRSLYRFLLKTLAKKKIKTAQKT